MGENLAGPFRPVHNANRKNVLAFYYPLGTQKSAKTPLPRAKVIKPFLQSCRFIIENFMRLLLFEESDSYTKILYSVFWIVYSIHLIIDTAFTKMIYEAGNCSTVVVNSKLSGNNSAALSLINLYDCLMVTSATPAISDISRWDFLSFEACEEKRNIVI